MKKIILSIFYLLVTSIFLFLVYFSLFGFETDKFNNQIQKKIKNTNQDLKIEINKVKLILDPFKFQINAKTLGTKLIHKKKSIDFEIIKTKISLKSLFEKEFSITNVNASTKSIEIKNLILFFQSLNRSTELFILEKFVKKGYLITDINLNFDNNGNIKDDYNINGLVKDTKINVFKKYKLDNLEFIFELDKENLKLQDLRIFFNKLKFSSNDLNIKKVNKEFEISGIIENNDLTLGNENINLLIKPYFPNIKVQKITFNSKNRFLFKINEKLKLKDFEIKSKINLASSSILNNLELKKFFPKINENIDLINQKLEIDYKKDFIKVKGSGNLRIQENVDQIDYLLIKKNNNYNFNTSLEIKNNPIKLNFLNYEKSNENNTIIKFKGYKKKEKQINFEAISLNEKNNKIEIKNLFFDQSFKIIDLEKILVDFLDKDNNFNKFTITKKNKRNYSLTGSIFNADNLIENLFANNQNFPKILNKDFDMSIQIDKLLLDKNYNLDNFNGNLSFKNQEIINGNLTGLFPGKKELRFTVKSKGNQKITTLFSDEADALVSRYKFIKGFKDGVLDFYSLKQDDVSISKIKIYDFKLKKLPALTKLLTLASLQGIADLVSGDGIRFNEFEMSFKNKNDVMTIDEIYAIGPAISILMDGYVEKDKLISLRGTLVPATTINKFIGSIPILGEILVGSKTGEGVFGVSFKIKGPPKNLETTVNPIKTLTPRFITRTLEKIKKN